MPEKEIKSRGGTKKWRTVKLKNGEYVLAVVRQKGPRGGTTVAGPVHHTKKKGNSHGTTHR
jgi:hypothetical protein